MRPRARPYLFGTQFANGLAENRDTIAGINGRIEVIESQLARGNQKFSQQVTENLQDEDSALRSAYLRMFVSEVTVSDQGIQICGSKSALERGLAKGLPRLEGSVPIFYQKWCRLRDSNT